MSDEVHDLWLEKVEKALESLRGNAERLIRQHDEEPHASRDRDARDDHH